MPAIARLAHADGGPTLVRIDMRADGKLSAASVGKSSGNPALDADAVAMAKNLTYVPATVAGASVADSYLLAVVHDSAH